jgi:hypothetical protein
MNLRLYRSESTIMWTLKDMKYSTGKKTESNRKNQLKIESNRFEPVFVSKNEPKPVDLNRFWFFKKKIFLFDYFFFINTKLD